MFAGLFPPAASHSTFLLLATASSGPGWAEGPHDQGWTQGPVIIKKMVTSVMTCCDMTRLYVKHQEASLLSCFIGILAEIV